MCDRRVIPPSLSRTVSACGEGRVCEDYSRSFLLQNLCAIVFVPCRGLALYAFTEICCFGVDKSI